MIHFCSSSWLASYSMLSTFFPSHIIQLITGTLPESDTCFTAFLNQGHLHFHLVCDLHITMVHQLSITGNDENRYVPKLIAFYFSFHFLFFLHIFIFIFTVNVNREILSPLANLNSNPSKSKSEIGNFDSFFCCFKFCHLSV